MSGIRVNVVEVASADVLGAILYAPRTQEDIAFMQTQADPRLWQNLNDTGRKFMEQTAHIQQQYQTIQYLAQQEANRHHSVANHHYVVYVTEPEQIRQVGIASQSTIMASPYVRSLYNEGRIDGFSDSWVNYEPTVPVQNTYEYHRMHDGWLLPDGSYGQYSQIDAYGESNMTILEKCNAHHLNAIVEEYLRDGVDVTNTHDPDAVVLRW